MDGALESAKGMATMAMAAIGATGDVIGEDPIGVIAMVGVPITATAIGVAIPATVITVTQVVTAITGMAATGATILGDTDTSKILN